MSDNEHAVTDLQEKAGPAPSSHSDSSHEGQTDSAADEAPTRKRAENKPSAEVQQSPGTGDGAENTSKTSVTPGGWGHWGSWGKSLLSTATATVATVGQGLSQVIEKAETSLGIPSPTDLSVQMEKEKEAGDTIPSPSSSCERTPSDGDGNVLGSAMGMLSSSSMGMLSSLSSVVQSTSKTVISGGLDALEFIGKKTMDVIAEGDPGFKKTKGLMNRTSTLSQVLREAKEREEQQTAEKVATETEKKAHYGMLFDEFQGLAHLEALEILSRESDAKVKSVLTTLSGEELNALREDLEQIRESFSVMEFDDDEVDDPQVDGGDDFVKELNDALKKLHVSTTAERLGKARRNAFERITDMKIPSETKQQPEGGDDDVPSKCTVEDVHFSAITSLAELTARSIEQFHKVAEMLLHTSTEGVTALEQAKILAQITVVVCKEISALSKKYTACLATIGSNEKGETLNPLITGVFLEASNSASYIQDAFQLLVPVLEMSHIERTADSSH